MLTVRLSSEEEKALHAYCLREGVSKTDVVKEAIELYLTQRKKSKNPYEAGADLFGQAGSGTKSNSVSYKKKLKELLREKHSH
jgi:Ribbon-helix-helix protein, copG family